MLKRGQVKIEDLTSGEKLKISNTDGLYKSLLIAKNYPAVDIEIKADNSKTLQLNEETSIDSGVKMKR
ncbi:hypothetical protein D3C87_1591940 [compost metagenome]